MVITDAQIDKAFILTDRADGLLDRDQLLMDQPLLLTVFIRSSKG